MRAIWSGTISFGLVSIPVKLYSATEPRQIELHNLCNICHTPLEYKRWCPVCKKEVSWKEVEKGYKVSKDRWIIIKKEELENIKIPTTKTIEIKEFIDASQIDPLYFEKSYYVVPQESGIKPYSLFVEALRLANKVAIGKVIIRNKEYLVALRAFKKGIVMHVLYYMNEVRSMDQFSELKNLVVVSKEELELARTLIKKLAEREFEIEKFKDRYTEALEELIKAKIEGKKMKPMEMGKLEEGQELMEALKTSIERLPSRKKEQ